MLKVIDLRNKNSASFRIATEQSKNISIENIVSNILIRVRKDGDKALRFYTSKFDKVDIQSFAVSEKEIGIVTANAEKKFVGILNEAALNIKTFHSAQIRKPFSLRGKNTALLQQLYRPIEKVGVYIPGGKAAYPSTVLMNVIPALVAGVKEIHLVTPPDKYGNVHRDVLLAASLLGVKHIYRIGGAQAIAALAYGTETIPSVDKIVGPGNIFVATAKKMVFGTVGIDSFAGPSEVVILADSSADPTFVASDLLAQAEHDERAIPILVTSSSALAIKVNKEVNRLLAGLARKNILQVALRNHGRIYLVGSIKQGIDVANKIAPEHLEIITTNDKAILDKIINAGSIFLGNSSPVAIGDYFAGPNHVLPTGRTARFSSPLSVDDFMKKSSVVRYTQKGIRNTAEQAALFADREGLTAHALSLRLRMRK